MGSSYDELGPHAPALDIAPVLQNVSLLLASQASVSSLNSTSSFYILSTGPQPEVERKEVGKEERRCKRCKGTRYKPPTSHCIVTAAG